VASLQTAFHSSNEITSRILLKGINPMLVLSRKENERLVIDGNIVVTVVRVAGGKVRLGIEAPPEIHVQREELRSRPLDGDHRQIFASRS
jgi:carbon storage regulator